jgi:type II secretory pathway pseudopilin PulG
MTKITSIKFIRTTRQAFTLTELLVVVSGISLLMAIAIPVFGRARAAAWQVVCQARLHQWALAFEGYATQNNGLYPHTDGLDYGDGNADNFGWVDMLPPLIGQQRWRDYKIWNRPTKGFYQCPSAKKIRRKDLLDYNPDRNGCFSYAMNCCLELDSSCWPPYGQAAGNNMPSFLNTASIKMPAKVILLFDQLLDPQKGYGGNNVNPHAGKHCGGYPRDFAERHFKKRGCLGGSILFCDYHIEWQDTIWKTEWPIDDLNFQAPPRNDPDWYP